MSTALDKNAIEAIVDLARRDNPVIEAPDFDVTGRYYRRDSDDGAWIEESADRLPVEGSFRDTESLANAISNDLQARPGAPSAAVYYGPNRITAVLDEGTTRWQHRMALARHPVFAALTQHLTTRSYRQRDLIRFLRATLNGHVPESVIEQFRMLKVATDGESNAVVAKGREAVDKRIQQQIRQQAGADIPDELAVTVPVYDLDELRDDVQHVTILVDTTTDDDGQVVFELTTVLNTIRDAERASLHLLISNLETRLEDVGHNADVPVYYGEA